MQSGVTLAADHLVAVVLLGQDAQTGLNDTTHQSEVQVQGATRLHAVLVGELSASEEQPLLVARQARALLEASLHGGHTVPGAQVQRDRAAIQTLHEHLHLDATCI